MTNNPRTIVCTGPITSQATTILEPFGEIIVASDLRPETLQALVSDAVALVVRGEGEITATIMDRAPRLKVIGRSGVGYDNVDIGAATERAIPVVYTPGAATDSVAEAAIMYMLALAKNASMWDRELRRGNWRSRFGASNGDLGGATLGIIGLGRIGSRVAQLARRFDARVLAYDPYVEDAAAKSVGASLIDLDALLRESDFISIHAALTDETRGMIGAAALSRVKPGAFLINLARGGIVSSLNDVDAALENGALAGCALDVFEPEPPDVGHPLFRRDNCLFAPHVVGLSRGAIERIFRSMADDVAAVLSGRTPKWVVNPEALG